MTTMKRTPPAAVSMTCQCQPVNSVVNGDGVVDARNLLLCRPRRLIRTNVRVRVV
jgi:hypothetical protein